MGRLRSSERRKSCGAARSEVCERAGSTDSVGLVMTECPGSGAGREGDTRTGSEVDARCNSGIADRGGMLEDVDGVSERPFTSCGVSTTLLGRHLRRVRVTTPQIFLSFLHRRVGVLAAVLCRFYPDGSILTCRKRWGGQRKKKKSLKGSGKCEGLSRRQEAVLGALVMWQAGLSGCRGNGRLPFLWPRSVAYSTFSFSSNSQ